MRKFEVLTLEVNSSIENCHGQLLQASKHNDFIFLSNDFNNTIWFTTNYMQFLIRSGNYEIVPLYGQLIKDLESFIYQVNFCLPVGYRLKTDLQALYDLLLNFETEPLHRIIIWNDAQDSLAANQKDFESIFESLVVAAYCNRNGISTVKENGTRYTVNQRNFFFFNNTQLDAIQYLLDWEYFIPSIDSTSGGFYSKLDFNVVGIKDVSV